MGPVVGREEDRSVNVGERWGWEPCSKRLISDTIAVPPGVPSVFQSSEPLTPSSAAKNRVPFNPVKERGNEPSAPARMSATSTVPGPDPSLFQSSSPLTPSSATKNRVFPRQ